MDIFGSTTVGDLVDDRRKRGAAKAPIAVGPFVSIKTVLELLIRENIYSVPVEKDGRSEGEFEGFVDLLDILAYVLREEKEHDRLRGDDLLEMLEMKLNYATTDVKSIINLSGEDPLVPVTATKPLREVVELFGRQDAPVLRVPVMDKNKMTDVVTQTDALRYLHFAGKKALGPAADLTVRELGLGLEPVQKVDANEPALVALGRMSSPDHREHAVALTDESGALLSTLSAKDLKVLTADNWSALDGTALQLCSQSRAMTEPTTAPIISVHLADTLWNVIEKMTACNVHRVYVTDDKRSPLGCIRLTDLFASLVALDGQRVNKNVQG